jgi:hypothetical protein
MKTVTLAWGASLAAAIAAVAAGLKAKPGTATPIIIRTLTATNQAAAPLLPAPGAIAVPGLTNQGPNTRYFLVLPKNANPCASRAPASKELKPGVYESLPYTALIVVPPPCADEARCIITPGNVDPAMPMLQPKLRFVPHNTGR